MEYKPISFVAYDFFKKQNLVRLTWIIAEIYVVIWKCCLGPKILGLAKQIFVGKICKVGNGTNFAFEYIHQIKLLIQWSWGWRNSWFRTFEKNWSGLYDNRLIFFAFLKLLYFFDFLSIVDLVWFLYL